MCRMAPETHLQYFKLLLKTFPSQIWTEFLNREPSVSKLEEIDGAYEESGFPGYIACIDCMHVHWKNCPIFLCGQYHNPKEGKRETISCEEFCYSNLYCWHSYVARRGTNNDITVLESGPLVIFILYSSREVLVSGGYKQASVVRPLLVLICLVDGIYPPSSIFAGPTRAPLSEKDQNMKTRQEAVRMYI